MDFFIEDEDDDYFTVVQVEADEDEPGAYTAQVDEPEPVEEPEPVKETPVFTLPPHPGKKLTAVAPSISAKEIQIIPPAVREIDPKIMDEIRNKISVMLKQETNTIFFWNPVNAYLLSICKSYTQAGIY